MLTDDQKKEYMDLMHESAKLLDDLQAYKNQKAAGPSQSDQTDSTTNPISTTVSANNNGSSDADSSSDETVATDVEPDATVQPTTGFSQSDADRLAELRAKLNLQ